MRDAQLVACKWDASSGILKYFKDTARRSGTDNHLARWGYLEMSKLAVIVIGNRKSGKSTTWNELFGRTVRTGSEMRPLKLSDGRTVSVFVVSGSPEERGIYVGDIVVGGARIVLCSLQYTEKARESVRFFADNGFALYVQWLNPGYHDESAAPDVLGFASFLLHAGAIVSIRNAQGNPRGRVRELRDYLSGWITDRRLDSTSRK